MKTKYEERSERQMEGGKGATWKIYLVLSL
jgi:hypothetical protein